MHCPSKPRAHVRGKCTHLWPETFYSETGGGEGTLSEALWPANSKGRQLQNQHGGEPIPKLSWLSQMYHRIYTLILIHIHTVTHTDTQEHIWEYTNIFTCTGTLINTTTLKFKNNKYLVWCHNVITSCYKCVNNSVVLFIISCSR